ncbi:peptidase M19 [Mesorhizobium sp. WSM4307]|uniref:dipeptidase n=1 Tax=unclassified Mesorhizobium TaxID=325217 RepID=UPI000BB0633C|nr:MULTISPECIES: dipeptidase [unclassified Mesorhizobium]PBB22356.1 peptidase M19 [Mesorhizobium sp. WSM4304]PBB74801.1 peptidase M19 [Mesorhizobium sp. WSM4308]TRC73085.1 peptidase M19 [Mesorhizobium sp. WSM4315]TRC83372.1 peptidase M19 [Mesorhizobium sp. WSM4307]
MDAERIHRDAVIIDAVAPLLDKKQYVDSYKVGGATCVAPTVAGNTDTPATALKTIGSWLHFIRSRKDLKLVQKASDIEAAKRDGQIGILFHFQGTGPFETDLNLVEAFQALGVRIVQLTYNRKDYVGDGCEEEIDGGLSRFGRALVQRLNENRVIVDCTHTGYKTTMDALSLTTRPAVFSHSNSAAVFPSKRNIKDDQAKAAAATGGLVGVTAVPQFVVPANGAAARPSLDDLIAHIDHFVSLIGIDHVGLGLDYWWGTLPFSDLDTVISQWEHAISGGAWSPDAYPRPPHYNPPEIETPEMFLGMTEGLIRRGYNEDDIRKILGLNWLRVFREVWGG